MPVPHLSAASLLLAATILAGADAPPAIYRQVGDGPPQTLLVDPDHAILVDGQGLMLWSMRLVREADGRLASYQWGRPTGSRLACDGASADAVLANGSAPRFVRQRDAGGQDWGPLTLAPASTSRAVRAAVAADLRRLVEAERSAAAALTLRLQSPGFTGAYADLPENQALQHQRGEARAWLRRTLQTSGWITAAYGAQALADLAELSPSVANDLRLLRTLQAGAQAALAKGGPEADAVAILDLAASTLGDPPPYGSLALMRPAAPHQGRATIETVIPIPADRAAVDRARSRAGLPTLAQAAAAMHAQVVAIGADGREAEAPASPQAPAASGPDLALLQRAGQDPRAALQDLAAGDPRFASALAEAEQGRVAALSAWVAAADSGSRRSYGMAIQFLPKQLDAHAPEQAAFAVRHLYEAFLAGAPADEAPPRIMVSRLLASGLVCRPTPPATAELARAAALAPVLEQALQRPDLAATPFAHPVADTLACIYFRQGRMEEAATAWKRAIELARGGAPALYRTRQHAAEHGGRPDALPR